MIIDYHVEVSNDPRKAYRKWHFLGIVVAESHRSAAYKVRDNKHEILIEHDDTHGVVFEFADGMAVRVGFGLIS